MIVQEDLARKSQSIGAPALIHTKGMDEIERLSCEGRSKATQT